VQGRRDSRIILKLINPVNLNLEKNERRGAEGKVSKHGGTNARIIISSSVSGSPFRELVGSAKNPLEVFKTMISRQKQHVRKFSKY